MEKMKKTCKHPVRKVCPSPDDLSVVLNDLRCEKCDVHFKNFARYRMHILKVHEKKALMKIEENEKNIQYHCPVQNCIYAIDCDRFFTQKRYLKQHYLKIHAEKKYPCTLCSKSYSTEAAKDAHVRVCGKMFDCMVCLKSYNSYEALLTHAKRNTHKVDQKYKKRPPKLKKKSGISLVHIPKLREIPILPKSPLAEEKDKDKGLLSTLTVIPKSSNSVSVQTAQINDSETISQETQTNNVQKEKTCQDSKETQTLNMIRKVIKPSPKVQKHKIADNLKSKSSESIINRDVSLTANFCSENLFPSSPLPLHDEVALPDLWEDKSTSGTQTSPEKYPFTDLNDTFCSQENSNMISEYPFSGFSSIETQTEQAYCQSLFDSDSLTRTFTLNSNNETQTTETYMNMEPLQLYNNSCTQTCDEILPLDLGLSDIQTQTAWSHFVDTTVSTETQTRNFSCEPGCEDSNHDCRSWLSIQTNHMETQTDLFSMLEGLE